MRYYLDCEFDGFGGNLMSLALIRQDGVSVYYVFDVTPTDPWVIQNVVPILNDCPITRHGKVRKEQAAVEIAGFLQGDLDPVIIADWPADIRYFCDLIEFSGGRMVNISGLTFKLVRVDAWPNDIKGAVRHNAWHDAEALRQKLETR